MNLWVIIHERQMKRTFYRVVESVEIPDHEKCIALFPNFDRENEGITDWIVIEGPFSPITLP